MAETITDAQYRKLSARYGSGLAIGPLLKKYWESEGFAAPPVGRAEIDHYVGRGAEGASVQDIRYDYWARKAFEWDTGPVGTEGSSGAAVGGVVAMWKADRYVGGEYLRDLTGRGRDMRVGSVGAARVLPGYLRLPGTAGNYASTPDSAALSITGDIDVRVKVALDDWTPALDGTFLAKWGTAGQHSYSFRIRTSGRPTWLVSSDGTTVAYSVDATAPVPFVDGATGWVRVAYVADNGAGSKSVTFYTSEDGVAWTVLGAPVVTAGPVSIFDGSLQLAIGTNSADNTDRLAGRVFAAQVRNGIGGSVVLDADFSARAEGTTSFVCSTGQTITINSASGADTNDPQWLPYTGFKYVALPGITGNHVVSTTSGPVSYSSFDFRVRVSLPAWPPSVEAPVGGGNSGVRTLFVTTAGKLRLRVINDAAVETGGTSPGTLPSLQPDAYVWLRGTKNWTTGEVTFHYSLDDTNDHSAVTWISLGEFAGAAGTNYPGQTHVLGIQTTAGAGPQCSLRAGGWLFDGSVVATFDASLLVEPYESSVHGGMTWSLVRTSSGRKLAVVDRPMFLFGTDDYMETPDQDDLDFGLSDSLTMMSVMRVYNRTVSGGLMGSYSSATADRGVGIQMSAASVQPIWTDGLIADNSGGTALPENGVMEAVVVQRDVAADRWYGWKITNPKPVGAVDVATQSLASVLAFRVGRRGGAGTNYADMEFVAAAIIRRVLSDAEIVALGQELLA